MNEVLATITGLAGYIDYHSFARPALRLLTAMVLGGMIGWERERHGRPAGLRTHLLVCVGCALITLAAHHIAQSYWELAMSTDMWPGLRVDPSRMAGHVISGIGFLGGGVILTLGTRIKGLTTAACLWVTAAMGLALGYGYWTGPLITFVVVMFALLTLGRMERKIMRRDRYVDLYLEFSQPGRHLREVVDVLEENSLEMLRYSLTREREYSEYSLNIRYTTAVSFEELSEQLMERLKESGLKKLHWER
jgi:putative Mg2+ transporter-C (MgtC) family protein